MGVERLAAADVGAEAVERLGLDATALDLMSAEAIAASLRRAASFLCPTTPAVLVGAVDDAVARLPGYTEQTREQIDTVFGFLVAYGDLLELQVDTETRTRRHVFLGSPAFVRRQSNACLLIGVRPDGAPLVAEELLSQVEYDGHLRMLPPTASELLTELLEAHGLIELLPEQWLRSPRASNAEELLALYMSRLDAAGPAGDIEGVTLIDPTARVSYYKGRWRPARRTDAGRFVARRPQAYGAELWCVVDIAGGEVMRLIDMPVLSPLAPGADEAWRLQAALDAIAGQPQRVRVYSGTRDGWCRLDFFSPVPSWVQRRLDVVGRPSMRSRGALFSYALPTVEVQEELRFLEEMLWMSADAQQEGASDAD